MSPLPGTLRLLTSLACVAAWTHADAKAEDTVRVNELSEAFGAPSMWSASAAVETSAGYKDNLLLSAAADEQSAFGRANVEVFMLGLRERWNYSVFLQSAHTRYFSGTTVKHDANAWLHTEAGYTLKDAFKFSLPVTGYYSDDVFDVSETELNRAVAEFEVWGGMVGPTVRWRFLRRGWVEAQAVGERKLYDDGANDSRIGEGRVRLGWRFGRVEAQLSGIRRWRDFDERVQYSISGRERPGTHLKMEEREGGVRIEVEWDQAGRWTTHTLALVLDARDNFSGYFDYRRERVAQDVGWESDAWKLQLEGSAERAEFRVQTVGVGIDATPRLRESYEVALRAERRIALRWALVGEYRWERNRSNDPIASYRVNEGLLGVRWNWDK